MTACAQAQRLLYMFFYFNLSQEAVLPAERTENGLTFKILFVHYAEVH